MTVPEFRQQAEYLQRLSLEMYARDLSHKEKVIYQAGIEELIAKAATHFNKLNIPNSNSPVNQWIVHPTCAEIDFGNRPEQIKKLVNNLRNSKNTHRRILVADPIHYALKDYALAEEGLFNHVIFTHTAEGIPLDFDILKQFRGARKNYVMGCYTDECVENFAEIIKTQIDTTPRKIRRLSYQPNGESYSVYNAIYSNLPQHLKDLVPPPRKENYTHP